jgi:NAD+ diphosphatase
MSRSRGERGEPSGVGAQPSLARSTLDRAAHRRGDAQWLAEAWPKARVLVIGTDGRALVHEGALVLVDSADAPEGERLFLGLEGEVPHFAVAVEAVEAVAVWAAAIVTVGGEAIEGVPVHLWDVGADLSDTDAGLFTAAVALVQWHRAYLYSPRTGVPTTVGEGGWVRVGPDGEQVFPRTDPAVIVAVHDGVPGPAGRILLGRNAASRLVPPRYSILAGFIEVGESAEAAVAREIREEVGLEVSEVAYVASESWPFPRSLMLGFTALADPAAPLKTDPEEIADARWFTRDEIADIFAGRDTTMSLPYPSSIANHLVRRWLGPPT